MKSVRMKNWSPKPSFRKGCVQNLLKCEQKNYQMKKIKILLLMSAIASTNVFSQSTDCTLQMCDMSNNNLCCTDTNCTGTGRLIIVMCSEL